MWIKKVPKKNKHDERDYFQKDLSDILQKCSIHCYGHLAAVNRSQAEFLMWFLIHATNITILVYILLTAWDNFTKNPILTSLYDTLYPISEIEFPAVTVCNINRISKRAALKLATELKDRDPDPDKDQEFFMQNIRYLGKLYDYDLEQDDHYSTQHFQEILENYYLDNATDIFSIQELLYQLAPKCEDILIRCFWKAIEFDCLDSVKMMEVKITPLGPCCSFNYMKTSKPDEIESEPHHTDSTGLDMGLILVVNGSSDDYFYPIANTIGFNVQIFQPFDIPDGPSGSVTESKVNLGTETFIRINGIPKKTAIDVKRYAIESRQCWFRDELSEKFNGRYERSECIVRCRKRSISILCGCIPFFYATSEADEKFGICNLQHIFCLNKYKIKWYTLVTQLTYMEGLEKEMEESLYCPDCLPSCSDVTYLVSTSQLPLVVSRRSQFGLINGISNISDLSIIRIFFGQSETWMYKQDVALYWFEILSNFGGMFGVLSGFSMISAFEVIYFVLKHLLRWLRQSIDFSFITNRRLHIYP